MPGTVHGFLKTKPHCSKGASVLINSLSEGRQRVEPMRAHAIAVLVAGVMLSASVVAPGAARAEGSPPRPSAGELESAFIGKVVTATGSVTIEHASAVVVQANIPAGSGVGPTKIGDLVYRG